MIGAQGRGRALRLRRRGACAGALLQVLAVQLCKLSAKVFAGVVWYRVWAATRGSAASHTQRSSSTTGSCAQPGCNALLPCTVCADHAPSLLQVVDASTANKDIFIKLGTPSAATHVLTVQPGQMIEVVIQNDRAGFMGGEYNSSSGLTSARNGREQHSFHLHGYHFWQVRGRRQDSRGVCWVLPC